jgi:hypothetical protein
LKFLFDNNLPPSLARGVAELSKVDPDIEEAVHLRAKFPGNSSDEYWMRQLLAEGGWVVISGDQFKKSKAERELLRQRGLTVFVLDPQWADHVYWDKAARLILWWPRIVDVAKLTSKTAMRVPWRFTSKSTFEQIRA